jgi:hypothetical protein
MTQILDGIYEKGTVRLLAEPAPFLSEGQHVKVLIGADSLEEERESWKLFALQSLARAYSDDEPEYRLEDLKEVNPDYAGG